MNQPILSDLCADLRALPESLATGKYGDVSSVPDHGYVNVSCILHLASRILHVSTNPQNSVYLVPCP